MRAGCEVSALGVDNEEVRLPVPRGTLASLDAAAGAWTEEIVNRYDAFNPIGQHCKTFGALRHGQEILCVPQVPKIMNFSFRGLEGGPRKSSRFGHVEADRSMRHLGRCAATDCAQLDNMHRSDFTMKQCADSG